MDMSSSEEAQVAYALIDQSWGLPASVSDHDSPYSISLPTSNTNDASSPNGVGAIALTTMEQWYEYYAVRTPSVGYLARQEEIDRIDKQPVKNKNQSRGGWFGRLFFGKSSTDTKAECEGNADDDFDAESDDVEHLQLSLDTNAINHEALSFHRFHLASERRASVTSKLSGDKQERYSVVLPVRICIGWDDNATMSNVNTVQSHLCIVGYGQIAEFPNLPELSVASKEQQAGSNDHIASNNHVSCAAKVSLTSDHNDLLSFATKLDKDDPRPLYDLRHCRAASIGSDCLIVSWGLGGDGSVVFYRRIESHKMSPRKTKRVEFEDKPTIGWRAVAYATPSDSVIETAMANMTPDPYLDQTYKHRQEEHNVGRLYELGSLRVTDLLPMVFDSTNMQQNFENISTPSAVLATSRLGGFIELLTLPDWIWRDQSSTPPQKVVDLSILSEVTAFSTSNHHTDIMAIDAYRTSVGLSMDRDRMHRPGGPPAEFVLVASGRPSSMDSQDATHKTTTGSEYSSRGTTLSFWGITAIRANDEKESCFGLSVICIQRCQIDNLGADSSVFITDPTVKYWSHLIPSSNDVAGKRRTKQKYDLNLFSTISASVPIVSIRFSPNLSVASTVNSGSLLAVLDHNGGVTVMDCSDCIRSIEQVDVHNPVEHSQVVVLADRDMSMSIQSNDRSLYLAQVSQIEWWYSPSRVMAGTDQSEDQCLIDTHSAGTHFLLTNSAVTRIKKNRSDIIKLIRLQSWNLALTEHAESVKPTDVFSIPIDSNDSVTVMLPMRYQATNETVSLLRKTFLSRQLSVCEIREFTNPTEIITVLLHQADPERALNVARSFGGTKYDGNSTMNKCQIQLWEQQRNIQALSLVSDHEYVIREALSLDQSLSKRDSEIGDIVQMKHLVYIYSEALRRWDQLKLVPHPRAEWLSAGAVQLRKSMRLAGTFELLVQHFADGEMVDKPVGDDLARRFLHVFQHCELLDVIKSAALRGDINALTIILVRHPVSTRIRMRLLEMIPLDIGMECYEHLLPCSFGDSEKNDCLFLPKSQIGLSKKFLDSLEMFLFLVESNIPTLPVVTDETDQNFIVRHYQEDYEFDRPNSDTSISREEVARWYLSKCLCAHNSTSNVQSVKRFCELALMRLGFVYFTEDGTYKMSRLNDLDSSESCSINKLVYLYSAADLLGRLRRGQVVASLFAPPANVVKHWGANMKIFRSLMQFCTVNASGVVSFLLENSTSSSVLNNHAVSFFFDKMVLNPSKGGHSKHENESSGLQYDAIVQLCLCELKQSKSRKRTMLFNNANDSVDFKVRLQRALSVCAIFASLGVNKWTDDEMVSFVCEIVDCTMNIVGEEWAVLLNGMIGELWSIYEFLPYSSSASPKQKYIVACLRLRLIIVRLYCKWSMQQIISRPIRSFVCCKILDDTNELSVQQDQRMFEAYSGVLVAVTRGFCENSVKRYGYGGDLLLDFISDVDEFDKLCFDSYSETTGFIGAIVLPLLLSQHSFGLLRDLLCARPSWFSPEKTRTALLAFLRTSSNEHISSSMQCLGALFPELLVESEKLRHLNDAKSFATDEMKVDAKLLEVLFSDQYARNTTSLVQVLISSYPESLLIGCGFWSDDVSKRAACADAVSYFFAQINATIDQITFNESGHVLPPMPGSLIMQLAGILDSLNSLDVLLIKQFMVNGALKLGLAHAAIAISCSMMCDAVHARQSKDVDFDARWTDQHDFIVQHCVIASITTPRIDNVRIMKDLCAYSLRLFDTNTSLQQIIIEVRSSLEYEEFITPPDSDALMLRDKKMHAKHFIDESEETSTRNPFYEMSFIFNEISQSTSINVSALISSLRHGCSDKNDVLNDLSQTFLNWAIVHAFQLTAHSALPAAKIRMIVELGASCWAELTGSKTASLVIDNAIEAFKTNVNGQGPSTGFTRPDPALAQRLHERGYSWNAARRACIMTNNEGYGEALGWAVAHFRDEDFDTPFLSINDGNISSPHRDLVSLIENLLHSISAYRQNGDSNMGMKPGVSNVTEIVKIVNLQPPVQPAESQRTSLPKLLVPASKPVEAARLKINDPSITLTSRPTMPRVHTGISTSAFQNIPPMALPTIEPPAPRMLTGISMSPRAQVDTNGEIIPANHSIAKGDKVLNSSESVSSIDGSLGSRVSINKQVKRGKVIGTQNLSAEDRRKLVIEGRRLLEEARNRNKGVVAPPTSIVTKSNHRPQS